MLPPAAGRRAPESLLAYKMNSMVSAVVGWREGESLTVTQSFTPSNDSAPPYLPWFVQVVDDGHPRPASGAFDSPSERSRMVIFCQILRDRPLVRSSSWSTASRTTGSWNRWT
jgi:hypothetical protein